MTRNAAAEQRRGPRRVSVNLQDPSMDQFGFNHQVDRDIMATIRPGQPALDAGTRGNRHAATAMGEGFCMRKCADAK